MIKTNKNIAKLEVGIALLIAVCTLFNGCKEKYLPEIKEASLNYLVVEGLINTGTDSTIFTLSRTFKLNSKAVEAGEKAAIVQVESEAGTTYVLPALTKAGRYGRSSLGLDPTQKYRLRIRTADKREYLSDFVESRTSPPIDELKYDFKNDHLNVYAYTHNPSGNSRYYRYSYIETEEYRADLISYYKVENKQIVRRKWPEESIWVCWRTIPSSNIILGSTISLTEDEMADVAIVSVARGSLRLRQGYSILVKQNVLTKEGFDFYETLKKNTESIGSLFDAQPSQMFGNIRSTTDPTENVIGFITAGTTTEKRITLMPAQMPLSWFIPPPAPDSVCLRTVASMLDTEIIAKHPVWMPLDLILGKYDATNNMNCVDCRLQGGTSIKPTFWP